MDQTVHFFSVSLYNESISFSEEVQWVSCNKMTRASCCTARWLRTFILLAVRPSTFSCKMVGLRNVLTICPWECQVWSTCITSSWKGRLPISGPRLNIGIGRYPSVLTDFVSVWHANCNNRLTHNPSCEKASTIRARALTKKFTKTLLPPNSADVDQVYQDFCNIISSAAKRSIPRGCRNNHIPCWDSECENLYRVFLRSDGNNSSRAATALLTRLDKKQRDRWSKAV